MAETTLDPCTVRLMEAELALHRLLTGGTDNIVSAQYSDGRQVQFRNYATDIEKLKLYITELKANPECTGSYKRRRPFGVNW
jgi:hypothetical protein